MSSFLAALGVAPTNNSKKKKKKQKQKRLPLKLQKWQSSSGPSPFVAKRPRPNFEIPQIVVTPPPAPINLAKFNERFPTRPKNWNEMVKLAVNTPLPPDEEEIPVAPPPPPPKVYIPKVKDEDSNWDKLTRKAASNINDPLGKWIETEKDANYDEMYAALKNRVLHHEKEASLQARK